ncbi:YbgA family protein [Arcobacter arenosus]|uniref:YbgA family protein n=1 Tax=Arcobacter arenosus TaxID=2576037 RepID=UPI003BAD3FD4
MKIGISTCLLGIQCRYDGQHSKDKFVYDELSKHFEFRSFCPEGQIYPTPREAIRQVRINGELIIRTTNTKKDVTKEIVDVSKSLVDSINEDELCGYILKSKSPTCGMARVKIYPDGEGQSENVGVGVFAKELMEKFPLLPIEEEGRLSDPWLKENFLMQVFAYKDIFEFMKTQPTFGELVDFHTSYKYLIYSKSHKSYKELGQIVANHEKKTLEEVLALYKQRFLEAIALKGRTSNTYNVLMHIFGYFKKYITKDEKEEILTSLEEFKQHIIPLVAIIKIIKIYVKRFNIEYLEKQKFLTPYPKEMALRSKVEAFK